MPRYFFDIDNGGHTADEDGSVLASRAAVETEAIKTLHQVSQIEALGLAQHPVTVTVRDEANAQVYQATLTLTTGWTDG